MNYVRALRIPKVVLRCSKKGEATGALPIIHRGVYTCNSSRNIVVVIIQISIVSILHVGKCTCGISIFSSSWCPRDNSCCLGGFSSQTIGLAITSIHTVQLFMVALNTSTGRICSLRCI
ncbi:hypothetical protein TcG_09665 [Trypanosoma cruzi]|nr:hypothetical protein TcG_09665 [Trypanosoma cruzi]